MQAAKKAAETIKETAANIGASAKSGLEKTKATVQEKTEKMTAHDPIQKEMATEKKEERISQAELEKQEAREHGQTMWADQMSTMPQQHGLGQSARATTHMGGQYTTTGPGATYSPTGEHGTGQPMRANQMPAMPEQHRLGQSTYMEGQYSPTGPGAIYSTTGELGQGQPMSMTGQQEHGLGHGLGELADEMMVGSNPAGMNTGTGRTRTHNTHVGGTASAPAPAPGSGPGFR